MIKVSNDEMARENLYRQSWMDFAAWESGNVDFWLNDDDEVIAYLRWDDRDASGIAFFEVRDRGQGIGGEIVRQLRAEKPGLYISGDIDSKACRRFWVRMGFDVADVETVR